MGQTFWNFSLAVYGEAVVRDECLKLQDQFGLDVNLVLLCAFLGAVHGVALTRDDIASARQQVRQWHDEVVGTLRTTRCNLKPFELGPETPFAKAAMKLRTQVKAAELESERIEQTILEQWAAIQLAGRPSGNSRDAVLANLQALLSAYDVGSERLTVANFMQHLIATALDRAGP
jgi:uncharacterized protein (TIGR02444 family)